MRRTRWATGALVLLAASTVRAQPSAAPDTGVARRAARPPDRWLGADKPKHFFMAGFTYAVAFSGARLAGLDRRPALTAALVPAIGVSIGKEVRDRRVTGLFSRRDLVADVLGIATYGALLARTVR